MLCKQARVSVRNGLQAPTLKDKVVLIAWLANATNMANPL